MDLGGWNLLFLSDGWGSGCTLSHLLSAKDKHIIYSLVPDFWLRNLLRFGVIESLFRLLYCTAKSSAPHSSLLFKCYPETCWRGQMWLEGALVGAWQLLSSGLPYPASLSPSFTLNCLRPALLFPQQEGRCQESARRQ